MPRIADLALDEMEVVEQPFRRRRNERAAVHLVGEDPVGLAQDAGVVFQPREEGASVATRVTGESEAGGEGLGPLLQPLDAQELGAERRFGGSGPAASEEAEQSELRRVAWSFCDSPVLRFGVESNLNRFDGAWPKAGGAPRSLQTGRQVMAVTCRRRQRRFLWWAWKREVRVEWRIVGLNFLYAALSVALMYVAYRIFDLLTPGVNFPAELKRGNIAVAIFIGALFVAIALIIGRALN